MTNGISWFGASIVTAHCLSVSKKGKEGSESFVEKMNRDNFNQRVNSVRYAMNQYGGATLIAATAIRASWFTDMSGAALQEALSAGIDLAISICKEVWKDAIGNLQFDEPVVTITPVDTLYNNIMQKLAQDEKEDEEF